ncbi:MAG: hypothetical protein ABIG10_02400 [bacterium]
MAAIFCLASLQLPQATIANPKKKIQRIKDGTSTNVSGGSNKAFYSENCNFTVGGSLFNSDKISGIGQYLNGYYVHFFGNVGLGIHVHANSVSNSGYNDMTFSETGFGWQIGPNIILKGESYNICLVFGAGHVQRTATVASGLSDRSDFITGIIRLGYRTHGRQFEDNWFNDTWIYVNYVFPLEVKNDSKWASINPELYEHYLKIGSEIAVWDLKIGKNFLASLGIGTGIIMYDFDNFKTLTEFGIQITPFFKQGKLGKVYVKLQEGSYNIWSRRVVFGAEINAYFFIDIVN